MDRRRLAALIVVVVLAVVLAIYFSPAQRCIRKGEANGTATADAIASCSPTLPQPFCSRGPCKPQIGTRATARCRSGTFSFSGDATSACSHDGGVAAWLGRG